ncbi:MAG: DEAD/DEAH box helicase [Alphaproteobacteria bacterium]|nr:DEAD/DEAH box helicase [Alphaproteobacteria bacterium]
MTENNFAALALSEPLLRALTAAQYSTPTPIQAAAIPQLLAGRDMIGLAQTGTGKTAAFMLPILQRLSKIGTRPMPKMPRTLILAPTRELALQIAEAARVLSKFTHLRIAVVMGGVGMGAQSKALGQGIDILIATPGRLLDHIDQGTCRLDRVEVFVLDEADRMLDMGFIRDIRRVVALLPKARQSMLFSATMPTEIDKLGQDLLKDPARVAVTPEQITVDRVEQRLYFVDAAAKRTLLVDLLQAPDMSRVIVFTRTKHGADRVAQHLAKSGIRTEAIHGNKSQGARQRALTQFKTGEARVLVATDIAARGIDVTNISHVVNFELPNEPEAYVHRIGRTARNGAAGIALSFCDSSERGQLRDIERLTKTPLVVVMGQRPTGHAGQHERPRQQQRPQKGRGQREGQNRGGRQRPRRAA